MRRPSHRCTAVSRTTSTRLRSLSLSLTGPGRSEVEIDDLGGARGCRNLQRSLLGPRTAAVFAISTNFSLGVGVDLAWGRCDLVDQGGWDREPLLTGILDGYVRDELRRVADNDVEVEVRIAGCVQLVGWACGVPVAHACFCHGVSFGYLGSVWEAGSPRLEFAIESSADEVWPPACNSPSRRGEF